MEVTHFGSEDEEAVSNDVMYRVLWPTPSDLSILDHLDRPSGVLRVWFLLLEGLASATVTCPRKFQPHTLDTLFQLLRDLIHVPGTDSPPMPQATLMLKQLLLVMVECVVQPTESIARLGCACIR
ncbi:hypothetical protein C0J52_05987 [Blattella germanica]|nr:hypothetical protein C0J52_05987 [Blattella germanica]